MDENGKQSSGLSWSGLVTIFLLFAGAVLVQQIPLQSSRPAEIESSLRLFENPQIVRARLWEDPFGAIARHVQEQSTKPEKSETPPKLGPQSKFCNSPEDGSGKNSKGPVDVLGVMVFGGDTEEGREMRRRMRYAVMSGLLASGLSPEDPEHLGYFHNPLSEKTADPTTSEQSKEAPHENGMQPESPYMPFEWFAQEGERKDGSTLNGHSVLIIWMDEGVYRRRPLERLAAVVPSIRQKFTQECINKELTSFKIIGPAGSMTLEAIYKEARTYHSTEKRKTQENKDTGPSKNQARQEKELSDFVNSENNQNTECQNSSEWADCLKGVEFFSATATAEIPLELQHANLLDMPGGPQLIRTTSTDKALMKSILGELELRGLNRACHGHNKCGSDGVLSDDIALVSEWDTDYGRKMPQAMIAAQYERCHQRAPSTLPKEKCDSKDRVHQFSYFKGIDGKISKASKSTSEDSKNGKDKKNSSPQENMERADGDSTYDYLRRLGTSLKETHQDLKRNGRAGIRAIGILGSDVYDKLLVLQALRPIFPQALFFTTDLDARYLHPDEHEWTRNLIVAAHFGLEPGHSLQQPRSYPPFRDSYQTATFISTRLALQGSIPLNVDEPCPDFANSAVNQAVPEHSLEQLRDVLGSLWEPRIFEVGRTQAIDLSPRRGSEADPSLPKRLCLGSTRVSGFYPDPSAGLEDRGKQFGLGLAALGVITFLSFLLVNKVRCAVMEAMKRLRHGASCHPWRLLIAVLITASVLVAALASIQRDLTTGEIEPFFWAEGVSIWPSEFIRMLAFVTSIYFLFKASRSIKESQRQISKRYFDGEHLIADNDGHIGKELESQLFRYWNIVCKPWRNNANPTSNFAAWRHYVEAGQVHWRIYRVIVLTALQLLFGFLLMNLFEPPIRPFRGDASKFIDVILLIASIVSFAVLIFFVVDATRLCIHWVRQTTAAQAWPEVTTRYYQNSFNLKPEFLDEWIDVQLMAEHTLAIQRLIYFPFIILFLVIVSRSTLIDNWRTPVGLFIILSINLAYAVSCAYFLRNAVEDARQKAINKLTGKLINAKGCHDENSKCVVSQLETLIESIKSMRAGVFSPFTQQPLVRAILVPLSGYGGIALIEYGLRYFH